MSDPVGVGDWPSQNNRLGDIAHVHAIGQFSLMYNMLEKMFGYVFQCSFPADGAYSETLFHQLNNRERADMLNAIMRFGEPNPEVRGLLADGDKAGDARLSTIGYRELAAHLRGATDLATAIANAQRASRQLAKRQLTWFRADPTIVWLDARTAREPALKLFQDFFDRQKESDG